MKPRHTVLGFFLFLAVSGGCTTTNPDFPMADSCSPGDRKCADPAPSPPVAMVCGRDENDMPGFINEPCPAATLCTSGLCTPSQGLMTCHSQTECAAGQVCVPLVADADARTVANYCVPAASAAAAPGQSCAKDSDCQSYRCLQNPSGKYCLQACATAQNCAASTTCRSFSVTVNGVQGTVLSCSAQ
jgi:hypothetical protein